MRRAWMGLIVTVALGAGACAAPQAPAVDLAAEEQAIRAVSAEWLGFTKGKDAAAIAGLFAEDGRIIWAGMDPVVGRAAIAEYLSGDFEANPDRVSDWSPDRVVVAASGDVAVEYGRYTSGAPEAKIEEEGSYATVYRKVDGAWLILSDSSVPSAPVN